MFNRIDLPLIPSVPAGIIASIPWLAIATFLVFVGLTSNPWFLMGLPPALALAALTFRRLGLLKGPSAVTRLLMENDQLHVQLSDGQRKDVSPAPASRLGSRLTLLKLQDNDATVKAYSAILIANRKYGLSNVPSNEYRRLRVWLRLGQQTRDDPTRSTE